MFSKPADATVAPQIPQHDGRMAAKSVFGPDLELTGQISTSGSLEILGTIDGNVAADTLIVGTEGKLSGSVRANTVDVKGHLEGRVDSQNFTMRASAHVKADVVYNKITIESGAVIDGRLAKLR